MEHQHFPTSHGKVSILKRIWYGVVGVAVFVAVLLLMLTFLGLDE